MTAGVTDGSLALDEPPHPRASPDTCVAAQASARRLVSALAAIDELLATLELVTRAYHLRLVWRDEAEMAEMGTTGMGTTGTMAGVQTTGHCPLVYGDPTTRTIWLSRRALRLCTLRSRLPAAVDVAAGSPQTNTRRQTTDVGPAARLARLQAEALLAVAARLATDNVVGHAVGYIVTAPRRLSAVAALPLDGGGALGRVLPIPVRRPVRRHIPPSSFPSDFPDDLSELAAWTPFPTAQQAPQAPQVPQVPSNATLLTRRTPRR